MSRNTAPTKTTVALVLARDQDACARCGKPNYGDRGWDWSIHHRRPRGMGGTTLAWVNRAANLIVLCGHATSGCHGWVESHRKIAYDEGFLVHLNGYRTSSEVLLPHIIYGPVYLDDTGGYTPAN